MDFTIKHELPTRVRLNCGYRAFTAVQAKLIIDLLEMQEGVLSVKVSERTGSIVLLFDNADRKNILLAMVKTLSDDYLNDAEVLAEIEPPPPRKSLLLSIISAFFWFYLKKIFLPLQVRELLIYWNSIPYILKGIGSAIEAKRLNADLLDATSLIFALTRKDYSTAANITFLLSLGETIEEWTKKTSMQDLASTLALKVDNVWLVKDGKEKEVPFNQVEIDDIILVRRGSVIPVDGEIFAGEGSINEASITGEPLPTNSFVGKSVYAGSVLEDGEIQVKIKHKGGTTVVEKIIQQIEDSQTLKSNTQFKAESFADSLVPYNFLGALLSWFIFRSKEKTAAFLAVDYSCAIKLATPLLFLSAMKEAAGNGVIIKGGKFIDGMANSDTIIFDKTGTLTLAQPHLTKVIATNENEMNETEVLRLAACLEEHFPHSVAKAVTKAAEEKEIHHEEEHTKVEYVVAHGIASSWQNKRVVIGSHHFIFDDEKVQLDQRQEKMLDSLDAPSSLLYLAVDNRLAGIFFIEDELRPESKAVIERLRNLGYNNIYLLTGDEKRTATRIAKASGIQDFYAELLPEDKLRILETLKEKSKGVVMVGDGINDTPALSAADVGISMQGADIAQAVSDVSLLRPSLDGIVETRKLSQEVMQRIKYSNYRILGLNSLFMLLSLTGTTSASLLAFLHNGVTVSEALLAMRPLNNNWYKEENN